MSIRKKIGKRIAEKRKDLEFTQEKVSDITGLTVNAISLIENGNVYVKTDSLYKICKALEFKLVELYEGY